MKVCFDRFKTYEKSVRLEPGADGGGEMSAEEFVGAVVEYWSSTDPEAPATGGWAGRSTGAEFHEDDSDHPLTGG